ncbi:uncharacterized protein LOC108673456 isoform X2 [Hyalella azteca]|uniref:Uncharacterized protein LOC108673456 isoform X2 n=1 Tax=Hyalella azteca TaxID=294128 RepID=A0A8B7NSV0_HYAAZ|nr:uncharacterized protein LOC108673456 isoform X2 [Hyalella azteca]
MRGDVFFPTTFSPTPPLPIIKSEHDSPPSSPSSTPPSTPPYSSSPSSTTSAFSSPVSAFSTPAPQYLSSSAPSHPSPFLSHSPPSSPCPTPPTTTVTAATLFFPPRSSTPYRRSHSLHRRDRVDQDEEEDGDVEDEDQDSEMASPRRRVVHNLHHRSLYRRHHRHRSVTRRSSSSEESSDKPSAPKSRVRDNPVHVDDHRRIGHVVDDDVEVEVEADDDAEIIDIELDEDEDDDDDVEDDAVEVVNDNDVVESSHHHHRMHDDADGVSGVAAIGAAAVGFEVATFLRRVTLKPRRTLSLSPTPARPGDMSMGRNLRAACCLDFTNKDDDDGLCRPADSDPENAKRKPQNDENGNLPDCPDKSVLADACNVSNNNNNRVGDPDHHTTNVTAAEGVGDDGRGSGNVRFARRGAVPLGASSSLPALSTLKRSSVKRPLEVTLPCQEIQYLDISYQKVQFSPIPRKKIAYHPVLHHTIHYCEVSYCGNTNNNNNSFFNFNAERPVKRKPLVRSHSFAV